MTALLPPFPTWPVRAALPVPIHALVYLEADRNYTTLYFADGTKIVYGKTLKRFEGCLPQEEFVRINKSYLVRRDYIRAQLSKSEIILQNGLRLKLARRRKV